MAKGAVAITVERCKGCGFCVEFCPTKVLALSSAFNSKGYHPPYVVSADKCSGCDLCGMYCPDFAIYGWRIVRPGSSRGPGAARGAAGNVAASGAVPIAAEITTEMPGTEGEVHAG